ncbi:MAG TPA: arsinothricin resistance N-acetyltransferase ArsN1 family B [Usitatibacter sp.]|nr:arsinothricin resistance N-acetyltransferase ArsN1 family B [Usitatibacter sp.]
MLPVDPRIRLVRREDAREIQAIYAPYVRDTVVSFEMEPPSVDEMARRIESILPWFPWLVWVEEGRVAGYAYASRHKERLAYQWSADVSAYVQRDFHRRGIGGALYRELLGLVRRQGFFNAYGGITLPNAASVALHESAGFEPLCVYRGVGFKMGRWRDVGWWHLRLAELPANPAPPRRFAELAPA